MKQAILLLTFYAVQASAHIDEFLQSGIPIPYKTQEKPVEMFVYHKINSPDNHHCGEVFVPGTEAGQKFWKTKSWQFASFKSGPCPNMYNFINKNVQSLDGYLGVVYREYGIHQKKMLRGIFGKTPVSWNNTVQCGSETNEIGLTVTNSLAPSIKFRTCNVSVDPKTGWACNHGTKFVDCDRRVKEGEQDVTLLLDANVETILPITFNADGSIDQVSQCYMTKPVGGFTGKILLDQTWWNNLQTTCG
jgi:hypothetical protein